VTRQAQVLLVCCSLWIGQFAMLAGTTTLFIDKAEHQQQIARGLGLGGLGIYVSSLLLAIGSFKRYRGAQQQFTLPASHRMQATE
jgi:hypothetical protein